eukprot:scaffold1410_cov386-Prasinococcus_capsulatus_cf.AAC.14
MSAGAQTTTKPSDVAFSESCASALYETLGYVSEDIRLHDLVAHDNRATRLTTSVPVASPLTRPARYPPAPAISTSSRPWIRQECCRSSSGLRMDISTLTFPSAE